MPKPNLPVPTSSFQVSNGGNQNREKKFGYLIYEVEPGFTVRLRKDIDPTMDPKKLKRIILNRVSAQRSRWKKRGYVEYLLKKKKELEMEVSVRRALLEMLNERTKCLNIKYRELEERTFATNQRLISAEAEAEGALAKLRELGDDIGSFDVTTLMNLLL
ncbi:unnamed protein product [Arabis nemorensis]|uniref:BZIP domain-containing protein n=1 Tax=Arabis nemorensis TaxID=586526 RepID=A0A565CIT1_9BRAS|nr:unnamed protein product [Arabis nemorensis]